MAGETVPGDGGGESQPGNADVVRPDALPETYWNAETKSPNYDALGKDLTELGTLREFRAGVEASIPKDGKYAFDLPKEFKIPEGKTWRPDPNDPLAKLALSVFGEHKLPQAAFTALSTGFAQFQLDLMKEADAEVATAKVKADAETAALGAGAETRRTALKTWMSSKDAAGIVSEQAAFLEPLLATKAGVEWLENFQKVWTAETKTRGNPSNGAGDPAKKSNAELLYGGTA